MGRKPTGKASKKDAATRKPMRPPRAEKPVPFRGSRERRGGQQSVTTWIYGEYGFFLLLPFRLCGGIWCFLLVFFLRVCYNILTHFLLFVMMRGCHDKDFSLFSFLSGGPVFRTSNNFLLDFFSLLLYNNFCKVYFIRFQAYWVKTMVFIVLALFLFEKERRI